MVLVPPKEGYEEFVPQAPLNCKLMNLHLQRQQPHKKRISSLPLILLRCYGKMNSQLQRKLLPDLCELIIIKNPLIVTTTTTIWKMSPAIRAVRVV